MRSAKSIQPAKACRRSPYRARHHQLDDPTRRDSRCHRTKRRSKETLIRLIHGLEETTEGRVVVDRVQNHWWFRVGRYRSAGFWH